MCGHWALGGSYSDTQALGLSTGRRVLPPGGSSSHSLYLLQHTLGQHSISTACLPAVISRMLVRLAGHLLQKVLPLSQLLNCSVTSAGRYMLTNAVVSTNSVKTMVKDALMISIIPTQVPYPTECLTRPRCQNLLLWFAAHSHRPTVTHAHSSNHARPCAAVICFVGIFCLWTTFGQPGI